MSKECPQGYNDSPKGSKGWLWQCPNMKLLEGDTSMEYEHYKCEKCGKTTKLDYDEMR